MRKFLFLALLGGLLCTGKSFATHIVGGEVELEYQEGNEYTLRLILYFDVFYGNPQAQDDTALVHFFSADGDFIVAHRLDLATNSFVPYTNPNCAVSQLSTRRLVYEKNIILNPPDFSNPEGYYVVWERCCRNSVIDNLVIPEETGQTFLLKFPAVVKDNEPFINSTPKLFPPLSDYACINRPFFFDFAGEDTDGDSLVYSLSHPLNSSVFTPVPVPTPPPHPLVGFTGSLTGDNPIPAVPGKGLKITNEGFLTITPTQAGLFVFSVLVEEFRDGELIGEVRRDFQMLVRDDCIFATPPSIEATLPNGEAYTEGDTLYFTPEDDRCFTVYVKDEEFDENVRVGVYPVNFRTEEDLTTFLSPVSGTINPLFQFEPDSLEVTVCLPECPLNEDGFYVLDFVAFDDACAKPLTDTVRMHIFSAPIINQAPELTASVPPDTLFAEFDNTLSFDLDGVDADGDSVDLYLLDPPFDFEDVMMEFTDRSGVGTVSSSYRWTLDCEVLQLGTQDIYPLTFVIEDRDECQQESADTVHRVIRVIPIENNQPFLSTEVVGGTAREIEGQLVVDFGTQLRILAVGTDADNDDLRLRLTNAQDSLVQLFGFDFQEATGRGRVEGELTWTAICDYLSLGEGVLGPVTLQFELEDEFCIFPKKDSLTLQVIAQDGPDPALEGEIPTIFTPNGDEYNATFAIPQLPAGNCFGQFDNVTIFNRWGDRVFESDQREFTWSGVGEPDGVYFWVVQYTNGTAFKGIVTLYR